MDLLNFYSMITKEGWVKDCLSDFHENRLAQMPPSLLSRKGQNGLLIITDVCYKLRVQSRTCFDLDCSCEMGFARQSFFSCNDMQA